jgi:hypothetical protein
MGDQSNSRCAKCQSKKQRSFNSEIALHFNGLEGLNKPIVWVFQEILVCLDCGHAQFAVPERELEVLRTGSPINDAAVWLGGEPADEQNQK